MASKARVIKKVKDGMVTIEDEAGYEHEVNCRILKRPELMAAASIYFGAGRVEWRRVSSEQIIKSLIDGTLPVVGEWRNEEATENQKRFLNRRGLMRYGMTKGEASDLISEIKSREGGGRPVGDGREWNGPKDEFGRPVVDDDDEIATPVVSPSVDVDLSEYVTKSDLAEELMPISESINDLVETVKAIRPIHYSITVADLPTVEVKEVVHPVFETLIKRVARRRNVFLAGPAGTGKSYLAEQVARTLDLPFGAISVSGGTTKSDFFGYMNAAGDPVRTVFWDTYENGGVFCIDEIDSGNPNVLNGVNQSLAGSLCAFAGGMIKKHDDFICIATANTLGNGANKEYIGRNPIDKATMNRFVKLFVAVDERIETLMVHRWLEDEAMASRWLSIIRACRLNVDRNNVHAVVSPRDAENGSVAILDGSTFETAARETFLYGMSVEDERKVLEGVSLNA